MKVKPVSSVKLLICYKSSKAVAVGSYSHYNVGGLAANALHTADVLRRYGIDVDPIGVKDLDEVRSAVGTFCPSHVVIEAVWVKPAEMIQLARDYPLVEFIVRAHSKMGFLQVEPEAIPVMRAIIDCGLRNLHFSSNNQEFAQSLSEVYGPTVYLPNLYDLNGSPKVTHVAGPVKIASFGANRLLKLHPSAALAALQIAKRLGRPLEFYINSDATPGGESVRRSVRNLLAGLPDVKLIEIKWQPADEFRKTIAAMDLVIQISATETFCMVAADAISSGVPAVVGPAISWMPKRFQADIDQTDEVAQIGVELIEHKPYAKRQADALNDYLWDAKQVWFQFLGLIEKPKFGLLDWILRLL